MIISDIDGVLTNGCVFFSSDNAYYKSFCYKDFDAVGEIKRAGVFFGIVTGEDDEIVALIKERMRPDFVIAGCKDKLKAIEAVCKKYDICMDNVCYLGDGKYDVDVLGSVGMGVSPNDAIFPAKKASMHVLTRRGGEGCLWEAYELICINNLILQT